MMYSGIRMSIRSVITLRELKNSEHKRNGKRDRTTTGGHDDDETDDDGTRWGSAGNEWAESADNGP